jgi:hypothetical protein
MSNKDHLDHEIEQGIKRLNKPQKVALYLELLFRLCRYRFAQFLQGLSPRAQMHWIGHHNRPRRHERALIAFVLLAPVVFLELNHQLLWSIAWGTAASIFVITYNSFVLIRRTVCEKSSSRW